MRLLDDAPMDPEVAAALDAIDSTLAGEAVDPQYAELAELALLLADDRPAVDPVFAHTLDERVAGQFGGAAREAERPSRRSTWSGWLAGGAAATLVAAVVALFVFVPGVNHASSSSSSSSSAASSSAASSAVGTTSSAGGGAASEDATPHRTSSGAAASSAAAPATTSSSGPSGQTPQPQPDGRKTIQSAQLNLSTAPSRVDDVAQEAFNVVGQENGIVNRSSVTQTGNADGNAFMQLSVPSSALSQTMTKLSQLTYAHVASRTDNSQDVNNQYVQAKRRLADAQALRTSLLKQLANAITTEQVDSLKAQIRDAERSISSDESALAALNHRIAYSNISLTIFAGSQPPVTATHHGSSGFTLGKATHDAGRVLVVAAGVLLIGLAVLLPVAAIAALAWWVGGMVTHRRRERALDLA